MPSVAFFRHFYSLHLMEGEGITVCVSFRLEDEEAALLILVAATKRMDGFRHRWVLVEMGRADACL